MVCKNICIQYKPEKQSLRPRVRYAVGQQYCSICDTFVKWAGIRCPCCSQLLRKKSRRSKEEKIRIS